MNQQSVQQSLSAVSSVGQLLLYGGFIDAERLRQGLAAQRASELPLGTLLQQNHVIEAREKEAVLRLQCRLRHLKPAAAPPLRIGQLLTEGGEISGEQLQCALAEQRGNRRLLGDILVEHGWLTAKRLRSWLALQKKLLRAAATASLMFGVAGVAHAGDSVVRDFWDYFHLKRFADGQSRTTEAAWGQTRSSTLSGLETVRRSFGELYRSQNGSTMLHFTDNGLEFSHRF